MPRDALDIFFFDKYGELKPILASFFLFLCLYISLIE